MTVRWPHGDPDALAKAIVSEPAYRVPPAESSAAPAKTLFEVLAEYLGHLLKPFFDWLHNVSGGGQPIGLGLGVVLLALVVVGLAYLIWRIGNALAGGRAAVQPGRRGIASGLAAVRSTADWRLLADRAAAAGDFAAAVAALFSAALALLDESALVPFDAARTPGEYRRMLRRATPAASGPFDTLAETFVRAAFDERPANGEDYSRALRAYEGLGAVAA